MKIYRGRRTPEGCSVVVIEEGEERPLDPRFDLRRHSPCGFEHGYNGSGPAQLSLALCADVLGDDDHAQRVYQTFKRRVVAAIEGDEWVLAEQEIRVVIASIEARD